MSKLFYKVMIEDLDNRGCAETEVSALLEMFQSAVRRLATTLAHKAEYQEVVPKIRTVC